MVQVLSLYQWLTARLLEICLLNMVQHAPSSQLMKRHFATCVLQVAAMIRLHLLSSMQRLKACGMTQLFLLDSQNISNLISRLWSHPLQVLSVRKTASHSRHQSLHLKRFFLPTSPIRLAKRHIQSRLVRRRPPLKMAMLLSHRLHRAPIHQIPQS